MRKRYVVRTLEGFYLEKSRFSGLSVWIADEAQDGAVVWLRRTEDIRGPRPREMRRTELLAEAKRLAAEWNAEERVAA